MSLRGAAAVRGVAERAPTRVSGEESLLERLSSVGIDAIADAGVGLADVDGLIAHPIGGVAQLVPATVAEVMGLSPSFAEIVDLGGATGAGMVSRAAAAIRAGLCSTCLCLTGTTRKRRAGGKRPPSSSPPRSRPIGHDRSPQAEFDFPYGMLGANIGYAMLANRYTHEYGLTDAQRAKVAVDQRTNANANPAAIFHAETLTIDDVLASELIAEPLHMLEIVMPAAGAAALVATSQELADAPRQKPGA